jgi:hypothetical protein
MASRGALTARMRASFSRVSGSDESGSSAAVAPDDNAQIVMKKARRLLIRLGFLLEPEFIK